MSAPLDELLSALELCVLERESSGGLRPLVPWPAWLRAAFATEDGPPASWSTFLENFLVDAEDFWAQGALGRLASGPWTEVGRDGQEVHLEAEAIRTEARAYLVLARLGERFHERQGELQAARERSLAYQRLLSEQSRQDVLLHCIVHDLASPLAVMEMGYSALEDGSLSAEERRRSLEICKRSAEKQRVLIDQLLTVFALEQGRVEERAGVDLSALAGDTVAALEPVFAAQGVRLSSALGGAPAMVDAPSRPRLERVLGNLLDNALRHSPRGSTVEVRLIEEAERVRLSVLDRGRGVAAEVVPGLFQKFRQDKRGGGRLGLGLYYCRITVREAGGEVEYRPRPEGGSIFELWLPRKGAELGGAGAPP